MSYKRREVFDYDPIKRKTTIWHEVDRGEVWAIETRQDATPIVEQNRAEYAATDSSTRWGPDGEVWAKVASIPEVEYWKAVKAGEFNPDDDASFLRWVSDRDRLDFRTRPGRLV